MTDVNHSNNKVTLGFWIYLMTDLIMFGVLFAVFAVLRNSTFGGPLATEIIDLPFVLVETLILLTSSFTCGLALLSARDNKTRAVLRFLLITFVLGVSFLAMELYEFSHLIGEGYTWQTSAFLSSFFALVGTHGLHIFSGLVWISVLIFFILKRGLTGSIIGKINLFGLFWHFLDVVWIFIFTIVYMMGKTG